MSTDDPDPPKREVRDAVSNKLLCSYAGGDVPRRGEPLTITTHDGGGHSEMKTYEVIAVLWSVSCHGRDADPPKDPWEHHYDHSAREAWACPTATIQVSEREKT